MVILEMREAAYDKVFELLDEVKDLGKEKKMAICKLEDAIYECYEASKKEGEYEDTQEDDESDIEFRSNYRGNMRKNMRNFNDEDDDMEMRGYRKSRGMRMRRNRMGRYSY